MFPVVPRCLSAVALGLCVLLIGSGCADEGRSTPAVAASQLAAFDTTRLTPASVRAAWRASDTTVSAPSPPDSARWIEDQLQQMSLREKIGQLFMVRLDGHFQNAESPSYREVVDLVENFEAGGIMFGPGTPMAQIVQVNALQEHAERPLLIAQDMEWGPAMRLDRTTEFPPAMALGATRNPALAYRVGYATAQEARALGVHQLYAPVADINNNPENPIINIRSFGETPSLVGSMASAYVEGAQRGGALATAKHFPGHGDTDVDSHRDLPVLRFDRARLDSVELVPFRRAIDAGVAGVMTGHLALPALEPDPGVPASLSPAVTDSVLRRDLGYDGLVVTDALNMRGVTKNFGPGEAAVRILAAGGDQILMSRDPRVARAAIRKALQEGRLTEATIDASVRRVLRAKARLDLHRERTVPIDTTRHEVATRSHDVLAGAVARRSLTLVRHDSATVPLTPPAERDVLVVTLSDSKWPGTGDAFVQGLYDRPAIESITRRRLDPRSDTDDMREVLDDAAEHDLVFVPTFLKVRAWSGSIGLSDLHRSFLTELVDDGPPTALVAFGNPYAPSDLDSPPETVLAAYGSGPHSQRAAAQALVGASGVSGRLPVTVPGLAEAETGVQRPQVAPRHDHPEAAGMDGRRLARIDSVLRASMLDGAFPGAALAVGREGVVAKQETYGYYTYDRTKTVVPSSPYDLASLTKVVATTTAAMLLVEEERLDLDATVASYLPNFGQSGKESITVRQLLTHSSGLPPYLDPDRRGDSPRAIVDTIMAMPLQYETGTKSEYSGLGMITLMRIIETVTGRRFDVFCRERIFEPLGMHDTGFRSVSTSPSDYVVPTLDSTGYRGSVHDPIARVMDGVSGNAGLFSTIEDLTRFATMLANDGAIYGQQFLEAETIEQFSSRADVPGSTRALGWDTKSTEGYSSAGDHFSAGSFGHTGYTGTSFWIDPEQDLYVILLTNRVYPDDTDEQIQQIRPAVANHAAQAIVGPPKPLLPAAPSASTRRAPAASE